MTQIQSVENARLTIDLPSSMHRLIKAHASLSNLSIRDFVITAINKKLDGEEVLEKRMNKTTIKTIEHSIKNHDKLKTFKNSDEMMTYLLGSNKTKKTKKSKK
jgi:uncharacterized protein (DUF1778 family)